jgi:hypothetical protein
MRSDFKPSLLGLVTNKYGLEPVHFAMERKMLLASSSAPNKPPRPDHRSAASALGRSHRLAVAGQPPGWVWRAR